MDILVNISKTLNILKVTLKALLPYGLFQIYFKAFPRGLSSIIDFLQNKKYKIINEIKDTKKGKRLFVVCNGPSVANENLNFLKFEDVMTVSKGYLLECFQEISPEYHVVPQMPRGSYYSDQDVAEIFMKIDESLEPASKVILSQKDEDICIKFNLFKNRRVYFLRMNISWDHFQNIVPREIDLAKPVPQVQTVGIMCIMAGLYLGYEEIILIGAEHNMHKGEYKYAYKDPSEVKNLVYQGKVLIPKSEVFEKLAIIYKQYENIKLVANYLSVKIINATSSSELDMFDKVDLSVYRHNYNKNQ